MPAKPRKRNPSKNIRLQDRDIQIFKTMAAFDGIMARRQIADLFFAKDPSAVRRRMRLLFDHRYVKQPDENQQAAAPEWMYCLDLRGYELVAGLEGRELSRSERKQLSDTDKWKTFNFGILKHHLEVGDFRIKVMQSIEKIPEMQLQRWISERAFRRWRPKATFYNHKGKPVTTTIYPDGFFQVRVPSNKKKGKFANAAFQVEIDRATESQVDIDDDKVRKGFAFIGNPDYEAMLGIKHGRCLMVTSSWERIDNMMVHPRRLDKEHQEDHSSSRVFYFTTFEEIRSADNVLTSSIWKKANRGNELLPAIDLMQV